MRLKSSRTSFPVLLPFLLLLLLLLLFLVYQRSREEASAKEAEYGSSRHERRRCTDFYDNHEICPMLVKRVSALRIVRAVFRRDIRVEGKIHRTIILHRR